MCLFSTTKFLEHNQDTMQTLKVFLIVFISLFIIKFHPVSAEAPNRSKEDNARIWVYKLSYCESGGREDALNPKDGGSRSVGLVQFKDSTFLGYVKRYNLPYTIKDIWDKDAQVDVAVHMLLDNPQNWRHWTNCTLKIGKPVL